MKKILSIFLLILLTFLTACGNANTTNSNKNQMKIELVIGVSGIDDKSFNQSCWDAIRKFAENNNIPKNNYNYTHSMTEEDLLTNLSIVSDKKPNVIIAPGYYFTEPLDIICEKYPDQKFILLDSISEKENVASITFATNEGSFLAGLVAGLKAKENNKNKVGFLGGVDLPIIQEFQAGFIYGLKTIDPEIKLISRFANDFANPVQGQKLAKEMYDEGAYIIYNVAGDTGNGLIKEAINRAKNGKEAWVIGVDRDQYEQGLYEENKSVVITSMLKKLGVAVYDNLEHINNDTFESGHQIYTLSNGGVEITENNPNIKEEWKPIINEYRKKVINDEITIPNALDELP